MANARFRDEVTRLSNQGLGRLLGVLKLDSRKGFVKTVHDEIIQPPGVGI
jgi:hypothetical protein